MIRLDSICVTIDGKEILKDISCSAEKDDFVVIVGPNGAGKSTLFDAINGKRSLTSGVITLGNQDITHLSAQKRAVMIAQLFQNPQSNTVSSMSVAQNLVLSNLKGIAPKCIDGMKHFPAHVIDMIANELGMDTKALLNTKMASLSGGQRQLIAFVMATLVPPQLLLLDEPTAALDPRSATQLLLFIKRYVKEHQVTTILITHDPELARALATKIWVIEDGMITRTFNEQDIQHLSSRDLIGHIDYSKIL